jgi:hypothetical protein
MKKIIRILDFAFKTRFGALVVFVSTILFGLHYEVDFPLVLTLSFGLSIAYGAWTVFGTGIILSVIDKKMKERKKFLFIMFPLLIWDLSRSIYTLLYSKNPTAKFCDSGIMIALGYVLLGIIYFLLTSRVVRPKPKGYIETKEQIEEHK